MTTPIRLTILAAATLFGRSLAAQTAPLTPRLMITPREAEGGSLVRVIVDQLPTSDGEGLTLVGRMAGEPLHFSIDEHGVAKAIGAVPMEVSDSVIAIVEVLHPSGRADTLRAKLTYPHQPPSTPGARSTGARRLRVDRKFSRQDAENDARVARENARAREVGRHAHETPQLWTSPFERPRAATITSTFGSKRLFNGRVGSSHGGVDFRGQTGETVRAANRGVVALVDTFFLAGNVVYIDHGAGVVTGYFHLSATRVAEGDTVEKGQEIGLVGATGRVTAAHLHWSARYGTLTVDPIDLITITGGRLPSPARRKAPRRGR
jgi:hypothetical protein